MASLGTGRPPRLYQPAMPHMKKLLTFAACVLAAVTRLHDGEPIWERGCSATMPAKPPLRVWALLGPHRGDNNQVLALAEALGLPFDEKKLTYNALRRLPPTWLGATLASVDRGSRARLQRSEERRVGKECRSRWSQRD